MIYILQREERWIKTLTVLSQDLFCFVQSRVSELLLLTDSFNEINKALWLSIITLKAYECWLRILQMNCYCGLKKYRKWFLIINNFPKNTKYTKDNAVLQWLIPYSMYYMGLVPDCGGLKAQKIPEEKRGKRVLTPTGDNDTHSIVSLIDPALKKIL